METSLALDSVADDDIQKLLEYGETLVKDDKQRVDKAIHDIVDQVFGQEKGFTCK